VEHNYDIKIHIYTNEHLENLLNDQVYKYSFIEFIHCSI